MINRKMNYVAFFMAAVLLTVLTAGCGTGDQASRSSDNVVSVNSDVDNPHIITLDQAKSAALGHSGLSENEVVFIKAKLEHDDGIAEYDIEFTADSVKYEYEIDAGDGKILEFSCESISQNGNDSASSSTEASGQITIDEAKNIALKHAGVTESEAEFTKAKLDYDNGTAEYDIEFIADSVKYEYEIDAEDGNVLEFSYESISKNGNDSASSSTKASGQITIDEAKNIALKHAGVTESKAEFTKAKLDHDNGTAEYDIEFIADSVKYEYEIDAEDGNVLEFSYESISKNGNDSASSSTKASGQITIDEAKNIALKHAGVTESEAEFTKAKLDYDDGTAEYDIEFIANDIEYEYEISADSGSVLESSAEKIKRTTSASASEQITIDEAKAVALEHAGFTEDQVKFTKSKLDYDDGMAEYEIEFKANGFEYEYKINASMGQIIEFDIDD